MDCLYINLESESSRRTFIEQNFAENTLPGWRLRRLEAVRSASVNESIRGSLRDTEKACFLSHRRAVTESVNIPGHVMILEDDAMFGQHSCRSIQSAVTSLPESGWDIIYSDLAVTNIHSMLELLEVRRRLSATRQEILMDLRKLQFAGATAYVVNRNSKLKVLDVLSKADVLDRPYDLYLRDRIRDAELSAKAIFPFATSLSDLADTSSIQPGDGKLTDLVWNAFRRVVWAERDVGAVLRSLESVGPDDLDSETYAIAKILALQMSPHFKRK